MIIFACHSSAEKKVFYVLSFQKEEQGAQL